MRHFRAWAAGGLVTAIVLGCGPAKELPDEIPKSTENGRAAGEGKAAVPEKSDPAALEIVDRAIKAHTNSNRTLLAKGKSSRVVANGTIKLTVTEGGNLIPVPSRRTIIASWPDKLKLTHEFQAHIPGTMTLILRGAFFWQGLNKVQTPNLNPQQTLDNMKTDGFGLQWLVLLFPLVEEGVVIYEPRKGAGTGTPPADTVRVSIPGRPVYRLHFSPNSGLLTQIDYHYVDVTGPVFSEWMLSDYQEFAGLRLPTDMKMARTTDRPKFRDVTEEWKVETWEFPEKLDDSAFDAPK
jgi:hypothetical protein